MEHRKVVRVEIEYDDGTIDRATGQEADEIWGAINGACVMSYIHGIPYSGPKLKPVPKEAK